MHIFTNATGSCGVITARVAFLRVQDTVSRVVSSCGGGGQGRGCDNSDVEKPQEIKKHLHIHHGNVSVYRRLKRADNSWACPFVVRFWMFTYACIGSLLTFINAKPPAAVSV